MEACANAGQQRKRFTRTKAWERRCLITTDLIALSLIPLLSSDTWPVSLTFAATTAVGLLLTEKYEIPLSPSHVLRERRGLEHIAVSFLMVTFLSHILRGHEPQVISTALTAIVILLFFRAVAAAAIAFTRRRGGELRALFIGAGLIAQEIAEELSNTSRSRIRPIGFLDHDDAVLNQSSLPLLGDLAEFERVVAENDVDVIVVMWGRIRDVELLRALRRAARCQLDVLYCPRFFSLKGATNNPHMIGGIPLERLGPAAENTIRYRVKRAIDIAASVILLVMLLPVLVLVSLAVKLSSPGPTLFRQIRIGQYGQPFELFKFRTMTVAHDGARSWRAGNANGNDDRTSIGRLLRKSSLDELPQLLNVLRGEMSLVGPRPERPVFVQQFEREVPDYQDRHRLPVGITGWAQVNDLRGDTSIARRARFDNTYIDEWRLALDLRILLSTVGRVARDVVSTEDRDTRTQPPLAS